MVYATLHCARPEEDTEWPISHLIPWSSTEPGARLVVSKPQWPFYLCLILLPPIIGVTECIAMPGFLCGLLGIQTLISRLAW